MPMDATPALTPLQSVALDTLIVNLRNAHALEKQVIAVLDPQLKMLDDYPDLRAALTLHIEQTREQARRLEAALESCGSSPSTLKDALLSFMGMSQASVQGFAGDGVLKAIVADMMTEHLEIATYRTLIVLAEMAGRSDLSLTLEQSLHEEETMADWFNQNLERLTRRFVELESAEKHGTDTRVAPHTSGGTASVGEVMSRGKPANRADLAGSDTPRSAANQGHTVAPTPGGSSDRAVNAEADLGTMRFRDRSTEV